MTKALLHVLAADCFSAATTAQNVTAAEGRTLLSNASDLEQVKWDVSERDRSMQAWESGTPSNHLAGCPPK